MVPKLHKKGTSFKGAANYLLHDKGRALTCDRVDWTESRNLAVQDPHMAWRIMAATALDQERLKTLAGIKATGRKSSASVLHLTLAWHPDEAHALTSQEMKAAANGAIKAIGAEDYQALIIAHNDEEHPHVHVLINRVHPEDGRMLPSSKEKLNLSRWAEEYERTRGQIFCEERVANNQARSQGIYTRYAKVLSRQAYERLGQEAFLANDNRSALERVAIEKAKDAQLSQESRRVAREHTDQWKALISELRTRKVKLNHRVAKAEDSMQARIRKGIRPAWRALHKAQARQLEKFQDQEQTVFGRVQNAFDALAEIKRRKKAILKNRLHVFVSSKARKKVLLAAQGAKARNLAAHQGRLERESRKRISGLKLSLRSKMSDGFLLRREQLIQKQETEKQNLHQQWQVRRAERQTPWFGKAPLSKSLLRGKDIFDTAAENKLSDREREKEKIKQRLKASRQRDNAKRRRDPDREY